MRVWGLLLACCACAAPRTDVRVFGSRRPNTPGDTATVCAVSVTNGRWALHTTVWRLVMLENRQLLAVRSGDARLACKPLLWMQGVSTDTVSMTDQPWSFTREPAQPPAYRSRV